MAEMKMPPTVTLVLSPERVNQVLAALALRPWAEVADAISDIKQQGDAAVNAFNSPNVDAPAPVLAPPAPVELNRAARRARK